MSFRWKIAQWFELRWWKNYLLGKNKEEYLEWKRGYWERVLLSVLEKKNIGTDKLVLDLGCGPAGVYVALPQNDVVAVDPLLDEYERSIPHFKRSDYANTSFVCSTMEEFDARGRTFDVVFCMNAINHVRDIAMGFAKLEEVCAMEGTVVLSIDAHNHSLFKYLFRMIPGDILHPHQYDLNEYEALLRSAGFEVAKRVLLKQEFFFGHWVMVGRRQKF